MAYEHYPRLWKVKESSKILFSNYEIPLAQDNYALCKVHVYIFCAAIATCIGDCMGKKL